MANPTSLPPLAHSKAEIDPGGPRGSGRGSILGCLRFQEEGGPFPLGSCSQPQAPDRGPELSLPGEVRGCGPTAWPPPCPSASCSEGPNLTWHLSLRLATSSHPMLLSGFVSHPPPIFVKCILSHPISIPTGQAPVILAGVGPPLYPPPSSGISVNHTDTP